MLENRGAFPKPRHPKESEIKKAYLEGLKHAWIEAEYNCHASTIRNIRDRYNLPKKDRTGKFLNKTTHDTDRTRPQPSK